MTYAQRVVNLATSYAPMQEQGDNDVFFQDYARGFITDNNLGEWCDAGLCAWFDMLGAVDLVGGYHVRTDITYNAMSDKGCEVDKEEAKVGDVIFYDFKDGARGKTSHIGMVAADHSNGASTWETIEANTTAKASNADQTSGGWVVRRTRPQTNIVGVMRPQWPTAEPTLAFRQVGLGCRGDQVWVFQAMAGLAVTGLFSQGDRDWLTDYQTSNKVGLWPANAQNKEKRGKPKRFVDAATWASLGGGLPVLQRLTAGWTLAERGV